MSSDLFVERCAMSMTPLLWERMLSTCSVVSDQEPVHVKGYEDGMKIHTRGRPDNSTDSFIGEYMHFR